MNNPLPEPWRKKTLPRASRMLPGRPVNIRSRKDDRNIRFSASGENRPHRRTQNHEERKNCYEENRKLYG